MSKQVVFVIGASGKVGTATVQTLSTKYDDKVEIRAGVRNPDKAETLKIIPNVTIVKAEMGSGDVLVDALKGVDALYLINPPVENRAELAISTAKSAKVAGVKYILLQSDQTMQTAGERTVFGKQYSEVEDAVSKLGVPYTFLRLPFFTENYWGLKDSIQGQSSIYHPQDPDKPFATIAVADIGKASASILANSSPHVGKSYKLVSDVHSLGDVAECFSSALEREVKCVRVPYEAAKKLFMDMSFPEWQAVGLIETSQLIDSGTSFTTEADLTTYKEITGEDPIDLKTWIKQYAAAFK